MKPSSGGATLPSRQLWPASTPQAVGTMPSRASRSAAAESAPAVIAAMRGASGSSTGSGVPVALRPAAT